MASKTNRSFRKRRNRKSCVIDTAFSVSLEGRLAAGAAAGASGRGTEAPLGGVACQLVANDNRLFYYDNRTRGEVDFLIDDYQTLSVVPMEVKSGKDYKRHVAISRFVTNADYGIQFGYVLSNNPTVETTNNIIYCPVYFSTFITSQPQPPSQSNLPNPYKAFYLKKF